MINAQNATRSSTRVAQAPPDRRIAFLREKVRLVDVMDHFGHRYRLNGNMICPFHEESHPSSRLYVDQDTFWCWVCSPDHGVDIVEYVIMANGLMAEVSHVPQLKQRGAAVLRAIDYLERTFGISLEAVPWEARLNQALHPPRPAPNPVQYWNSQHELLLFLMLRFPDQKKWDIYAPVVRQLMRMKNLPVPDQAPLWNKAREHITTQLSLPSSCA